MNSYLERINLRSGRPGRLLAGSLLVALLLVSLLVWRPSLPFDLLSQRFPTFVTIFLGIFIEAAPFLLAGSLVSGLIEVYVSSDALARFIPRRAVPAALVGAFLGLAFPVCECGVVPVTRRLYQKGLPLPVGVAFLLAAPVVNPVVFASTFAAFGWGPILIGRILLTVLIAFLVGLLFSLAQPAAVLLPAAQSESHSDHPHNHSHEHDELSDRLQTSSPSSPSSQGTQGTRRNSKYEVVSGQLQNVGRFWRALVTAGDDFLDMGRYLVFGAMMAAAMQTIVPQSALLAIGRGPVSSVVALVVLAFVLSICSTVDAFLALSFVNSFTPGAILAFLVFGPMVDIKSSLMFLRVFRRRVVLYLILLPLLLTALATIYLNLNVGW
ncbi:MAG: permease [Chloroflexota bacterium]